MVEYHSGHVWPRWVKERKKLTEYKKARNKYNAEIKPHIDYLSDVWAACDEEHFQKVTLHRRVGKLILPDPSLIKNKQKVYEKKRSFWTKNNNKNKNKKTRQDVNFQENSIFQSYIQYKNKQTIHLFFASWIVVEGRARETDNVLIYFKDLRNFLTPR